jgi:hypothetical protein
MNPYTSAGRKVSTLRRDRRDRRTKFVVVFLTLVLTVLSVFATACSSTQGAVAPEQEIIQAPIASTQAIAGARAIIAAYPTAARVADGVELSVIEIPIDRAG